MKLDMLEVINFSARPTLWSSLPNGQIYIFNREFDPG